MRVEWMFSSVMLVLQAIDLTTLLLATRLRNDARAFHLRPPRIQNQHRNVLLDGRQDGGRMQHLRAEIGQLRGFGERDTLTRWPPGMTVGSAVSMPSTSVQIWISSAPMPAPTMDAVKSDPPRPSVVVTPCSVAPMNPPITTTRSRASGGIVGRELLVGLVEQRRGLRVPVIGDDHLARIDVHGVHSVMLEMIGDDQARQPLAEAGDGVDGARRQLAQHRQPFHQFRQFLKMLVDGALHAGFAQMKIAQRERVRASASSRWPPTA